MMNDMEFKINILKSRMKRNSSMSPKIKAFISVCVFFCFCYCFGSRDNISKSQDIADNIVWIISTLILIGGFYLEIYQLEVENLKNKKEVAEIRGEVLQDHIENREITEPAKEVTVVFSTIFYSVLLVFVIIVRIMWL